MQEAPQILTGQFKADEKNFVNLVRSMLGGTLETQVDFIRHTLNEMEDLDSIMKLMKYPMSEVDKEHLALSILKVVSELSPIGAELVKAGMLFSDLLVMLSQYSQTLTAKPEPLAASNITNIENLPETC